MKANTKKILLTILALIVIAALVIFAARNLLGKEDAKIGDIIAKNSSEKTQKTIDNEAAANLLKQLPSDLVLGDKNAPITMIEYASLSCPHCATFYSDAFPKLNEEYIKTGKVKFIYRDFPLNQPALVAAQLGLCQVKNHEADAEKYYDFVKLMFKTQESWAFDEKFASKLETITRLDGMSAGKFNSCVKDAKMQEELLKRRMEASQALQISSTPTFFVNKEVISGYSGYGEIKNAIEKQLSFKNAAEENKAK
ncbi:MAG: DsbA oxidoreductase [Rickettsiaceae bacterium]|jgi:protein-disulfide isomerase|nr:DsbA oxidoreductase [Rickettsiaceae bacterium]